MSKSFPIVYGPRVRSTEEPELSADVRVYNSVNSGPATLVAKVSTPVSESSDICEDFVVENFKARKAKGEIFNNSFNHRKSKFSAGGGGYLAMHQTVNSRYWTEGQGSVTEYLIRSMGGEIHSTSYIDNLYEIQQLRNEVNLLATNRLDQPTVQMMEDFLEFGKTAEMMRHPIDTMYGLSQKFKKAVNTSYNYSRARKKDGRKTGFKDYGDAIASTWLTDRFGFAQPIYSMMNLHDAYLQSKTNHHVGMEKAGAKKSQDFDSSRSVTLESGTSSVTFSVVDKTTQSFGAYYRYENGAPAYETLSGQLGLRLKDLPKGVWQMMPYTWVLDRFVDVSSFIGAGMKLADPKIKIRVAGTTYFGEAFFSVKAVSANSPGFVVAVDGDVMTTEVSSLQRTPGVPSFHELTPRFKLSPGNTPIANTLDLLSLVMKNLGYKRHER